jgi:hypothetical protein
MFGARTGTMIGSNFNATLIIFKNFASNDWNIGIDGETTICQFIQQIHDRNDIVESRRQGNVFSFCSAKRHKGLTFGNRNDGTSGIHNAITSARMDRIGII